MIALPGVCGACRLPVVYSRGSWRDPFARGLGMPHVCGFDAVPVSPRGVCGAWMPKARERCARQPGHRTNMHRTRYALDNALRMKTGRAA